MDLLKDVYRSIRLEGSSVLFSTLSAPWLKQARSASRPQLFFVSAGHTWVKCKSLPEPLYLRRGDALFLNDTGTYGLADNPFALLQNTSLAALQADSDAHCHLMRVSFGIDSRLPHPRLDTLPSQLSLSIPDESHAIWALLRVMNSEMDNRQSGYVAIVDKLCELFLIYVLRAQAAREPTMPGLTNALNDPMTCRALQLIHQQPDKNWTLSTLASTVGLSRSAFAERFRRLVGVPPKTYLTSWRMHAARELLSNPYVRLSAVSRQVGYSSDIAFSRAFKQFFGESPSVARSQLLATSENANL